MSERDNPGGSGSQGPNKDDSRPSSQPMPTGPSYYGNAPIQFRVRGSTITGASPPSYVTLDDIMKAAHGMQNMALAHEIAVDNDFLLEPFEPPDNSYQKLVKETMHRAYFDILREQLDSDPPEYKQALVLLEDVKQGLFSILLPRHTRIREMIEEILDTDFIKQQAENNSLDFHKYAAFVIDLMAKLAAPARDEMIQNITKLTDTVEVFRAILETLEVLKLDLANTLITMIRPYVQKESVQYEKAKFEDMLKLTEGGLENTRAWLRRNIDRSELTLPVTDPDVIRNVTAQTLAKAFLELLEWDKNNAYPETMKLDEPRFTDLGGQVFRLMCASSLLLVCPTVGNESAAANHKFNLKERIVSLIAHVGNNLQLKMALPSVVEEVLQCTEELLDLIHEEPLTADTRELITNQITSLSDPEHKVRQIVRQRVLEFLKMVLVCAGGSRQIPVGLSVMARELTDISGTLLRYVMHNKAVFTSYYMDIVTEELSQT